MKKCWKKVNGPDDYVIFKAGSDIVYQYSIYRAYSDNSYERFTKVSILKYPSDLETDLQEASPEEFSFIELMDKTNRNVFKIEWLERHCTIPDSKKRITTQEDLEKNAGKYVHLKYQKNTVKGILLKGKVYWGVAHNDDKSLVFACGDVYNTGKPYNMKHFWTFGIKDIKEYGHYGVLLSLEEPNFETINHYEI